DHDRYLNLGIKVEKLADARGEPGRAERDRGGDLQRPFWPVLRFRQHRLGHGKLCEDLARGAIEQVALLGEDEAAGMAMKQRHGEAFLERADLPADRRLAQIE